MTRSIAFVAFCATTLTLTVIGPNAHAASVTLVGSSLTLGPGPLYGSGSEQNNVVNSPGAPATGSILFDPTGPTLTAGTPWVQNGQVYAFGCGTCQTVVQWFFTGSESGFGITFHVPGVADFTEGNQNNSAYGGGPPLAGGKVQFIGTTVVHNASGPFAIPFSLTWPTGLVDNSSAQPTPGSGLPNIIFSYVDLTTFESTGLLALTKTVTDGFVFALNDNGGPDDDHDDFVGFAIVSIAVEDPASTPIPGALPLFGSVLVGGFLLRKWRRRH
jgi:hypothetical protein